MTQKQLQELDRAFGPRAEEPGLPLIPAFPYSGPLEDVPLKK